jgi:cbb3-type cytochrome oxidase subunit 3
MRFSDIIASLNISTYPQVALVIFLSVFVLISLRLLRREATAEANQAGNLPLEDAPLRHAPTDTSN